MKNVPQATEDEFIPITRLSAEIRKATGSDGPGWRRLHAMCCDAKFPAHQRGRAWGVYRTDLGGVLVALGLTSDEMLPEGTQVAGGAKRGRQDGQQLQAA